MGKEPGDPGQHRQESQDPGSSGHEIDGSSSYVRPAADGENVERTP